MRQTLYLLVSCLLLVSHSHADEGLQINDAWIPQAPPVAMMHAGYAQVKNTSKQAVVIVAAESADYDAVEIHKTVTEGGMSRMIAQDKITVAAGNTVSFERGGLHLMLMHPKRKLKMGDTVKINFITEDKKSFAFTATVKAATLGDDDHSHHHH